LIFLGFARTVLRDHVRERVVPYHRSRFPVGGKAVAVYTERDVLIRVSEPCRTFQQPTGGENIMTDADRTQLEIAELRRRLEHLEAQHSEQLQNTATFLQAVEGRAPTQAKWERLIATAIGAIRRGPELEAKREQGLLPMYAPLATRVGINDGRDRRPRDEQLARTHRRSNAAPRGAGTYLAQAAVTIPRGGEQLTGRSLFRRDASWQFEVPDIAVYGQVTCYWDDWITAKPLR
jgi:hypothetical protein